MEKSSVESVPTPTEQSQYNLPGTYVQAGNVL